MSESYPKDPRVLSVDCDNHIQPLNHRFWEKGFWTKTISNYIHINTFAYIYIHMYKHIYKCICIYLVWKIEVFEHG